MWYVQSFQASRLVSCRVEVQRFNRGCLLPSGLIYDYHLALAPKGMHI